MSTCRITFNYDTEHELEANITRFMAKRGFRVERASEQFISVGALAAEVGRQVSSVSRSLRLACCPPFVAKRGATGRNIEIQPNPELMGFLRVVTLSGSRARAQLRFYVNTNEAV